MPKEFDAMNTMNRKWMQHFIFTLIASGIFVADQISKWFAVKCLTHGMDGQDGPLSFYDRLQRFLWRQHPASDLPISVIDNFWHFRYVENPGSAWGFLSHVQSSIRTPFFLTIAAGAMVYVLLYYWRTAPQQHALRIGLALIFGGAAGNFFDRFRLGYVIDFIDWHYFDKAAWPTFNVADAAITTGVALLILDMFFETNRK